MPRCPWTSAHVPVPCAVMALKLVTGRGHHQEGSRAESCRSPTESPYLDVALKPPTHLLTVSTID